MLSTIFSGDETVNASALFLAFGVGFVGSIICGLLFRVARSRAKVSSEVTSESPLTLPQPKRSYKSKLAQNIELETVNVDNGPVPALNLELAKKHSQSSIDGSTTVGSRSSTESVRVEVDISGSETWINEADALNTKASMKRDMAIDDLDAWDGTMQFCLSELETELKIKLKKISDAIDQLNREGDVILGACRGKERYRILMGMIREKKVVLDQLRELAA